MELIAEPGWLFFLFGAALIAGFVDTLAGGGGLITLPALLIAQVPPLAALATNKLQAASGTLTASLRMLQSGLVRWPEVRGLFLFSLLGSALGTLLVQQLDTGALELVIPVVLIVIAGYYLLVRNVDAREPRIRERTYRQYVASGIGFYDGFFGPGTGSLFAFTRNALCGDGLIDATARAKIMNFASNAVSLVLFALGGHMLWLAGGVMILGQIIGATLASRLIVRGQVAWIRPTLVTVCILMALYSLYDAIS